MPCETSGPQCLANVADLEGGGNEYFLVRIPSHLPPSAIINRSLNPRQPELIQHGGFNFEPVLHKDQAPRTVIIPGEGGAKVVSLDMVGVVTLQEAVVVPPPPKIELPPKYKVPAPQDLQEERHPIYGMAVKRQTVKSELDVSLTEPKKKKKKKHKE